MQFGDMLGVYVQLQVQQGVFVMLGAGHFSPLVRVPRSGAQHNLTCVSVSTVSRVAMWAVASDLLWESCVGML